MGGMKKERREEEGREQLQKNRSIFLAAEPTNYKYITFLEFCRFLS